jgi:hypothetical protein
MATGGLLGQQAAELGQRRRDLVAVDDHVDHAVLLEIFGALEAVGQLLADGLLDHARAGEADQRAGLGDVDVAQHGVGGGDAAGGRVGQHDEIGQAGSTQAPHRDRGARQLHQREDALLHARPAGRREDDIGRAHLERRLGALDEGLAGGHAERAAHEVEVLHRDGHRQAFDRALADLEGVGGAGLGAGVLQPVDIALLVAELQRVDRDLGQGDLGPLAVVEGHAQPVGRGDAHMVVGAGDDEAVGLDVLVEDHLPGIGALDPEVLGALALEQGLDARADDVGNPVHRIILE